MRSSARHFLKLNEYTNFARSMCALTNQINMRAFRNQRYYEIETRN